MSVVAGLDAFKEALAGHENSYVLIGGGACSILFNEAGADFRLTKDLDIVVIADECEASFGETLWEFVKKGGYSAGTRKDGSCSYYRFTLPKDSPLVGKYPGQIELFARHPNFELGNKEPWVAPLPFDDTVSSLSAIILDDGYFEFIKSNATIVEGVSTLSALHIIPLKMRAHIDNNRLHNDGVSVSDKVLRKHRADVLKLASLLSSGSKLELEGNIRADAEAFLADTEGFVSRETNRKTRASLEDALTFLRDVYL